MWIARVIARAFGPFSDETLELGPGMNVVVGPNEAGKSSWHAATRLAITGLRRGRGRATAAEAALEARHRPWDATERWEVEARLLLADGRQIDISQDLAGKVACRAVDVDLGRDVSDEIMDGTPDASRWLGLDRDAFSATVSVSQAQIMAVATAEAAEGLQGFMQRAAATRGADATAAEAIERLTEFRRGAVGADKISAKGPLRRARTELAAAAEALEDARRRHAGYLERAAAAEAAGERVATARRALSEAEAAAARQLADRARARLQRAEELAARHPSRPAGATARDERADVVAAALEAWQRRPHPARLGGRPAADLETALAQLPEMPDGDRRPDVSVTSASRTLDVAVEALKTHEDGGPPDDAAAPAGSDVRRTNGVSGMALFAVAGVLLAGGLVAAALGAVAVGAVLLVAGGGVGLVGWRSAAAVRRDREARAGEAIRLRLEREAQAGLGARAGRAARAGHGRPRRVGRGTDRARAAGGRRPRGRAARVPLRLRCPRHRRRARGAARVARARAGVAACGRSRSRRGRSRGPRRGGSAPGSRARQLPANRRWPPMSLFITSKRGARADARRTGRRNRRLPSGRSCAPSWTAPRSSSCALRRPPSSTARIGWRSLRQRR